jgi:uncharacterized protein (TIGR00725 family)
MAPRPGRPQIAVVGPGEADERALSLAEEAGRGIAASGAVLVCGGLGGVMEAACRGAREAGGLTIGILPGDDRRSANDYVEIPLPTGLGEARNALVARAAEAMIAIGGGYGTLAEIAFALRAGTPVVGLDTWEVARRGQPVARIERAATAEDAVALALGRATGDRR